MFFCLTLLFLAAALAGAATTGNAAAAKPTVTITNLKSGQKLTNATFTVTGTAAGSGGISNVFYSLNQGGWLGATNVSHWTNWSAPVSLRPGTNTFSAAAVDSNAVYSVTNTVSFFNVVTGMLTVLTNGNGSVSPAYSGVPLNIGASYSITAKPASGTPSGFGFRYWSDGNSNILSAGAAYKFLMTSNLTLIANFGYIGIPTILATATTTNSDGYPADFVVHGTTKDKLGVTNVYYQLAGGAWQTATTTNHWTNWMADVQLGPGANMFNAYAVNISNNPSALYTAQLFYNSAPASLAGHSAVVTDLNNQPLFTVAFGKTTFSQHSQNSNYVDGVGSYTYSPAGGSGNLKAKYTAPPGVVNRTQNYGMAFIIPSYAYVTITNSTRTNAAYMRFTAISNLAPATIAGQLIWSVGSQGGGSGAQFQKTTFITSDLRTTDTNAGTYTYAQYSPIGSLIKLTSTNGTAYVLASYTATNYGTYSEADYTTANVTNGTDTGNFIVGTQLAGGNAPLTISNRSFQIFSVDGSFNEEFGLDTFSQDTLTTNYDNAVGTYTYTRATTNIGQLDITMTEPPSVAGTNSAARLLFLGSDIGLFTNEDGTFSTFAMTSATNYAPASITNLTVPVGFFGGSLQLDTNGSFSYFVFPSTFTGTYTYTPYSPGTAMVQLSYVYSNAITGIDWLQLNFKATNSGNIFWSQYDTNNNYIDIYYQGTFTAH